MIRRQWACSNMVLVFSFVLVFGDVISAFAGSGGDLDAASKEAVYETQKTITNPLEREKATKGNPEAQEVKRQLESLGASPEATEQIYGLAADIFGDLAKDADGNPEKMLLMLQEAKRNPQAFGGKLTPAQRQKLLEISGKLPKGAPAKK